MKEYSVGAHGEPVDLSKLVGRRLSDETYQAAHASLVIPCHDVYIAVEHQGEAGLLLVTRKEEPMKGALWPIGGRILRGMSTEDSLRKKSIQECGLGLEDITYLGVSRVFFQEDALGHGRGNDAFGFNYFARGVGELNLNDLHERPTVITPVRYADFRDGRHPYMLEFMDQAIDILGGKL